jgi:hypothetical protein
VAPIKYLVFLFRSFVETVILPPRFVCSKKTQTGSARMTDATYFRNDARSDYQQPASNWTVLMGGAATMFAMATLAAVLWV